MEKDVIQQKAYELWEAEGRPHGRDIEHWERAETAITGGAPKTAKSGDGETKKASKLKSDDRSTKQAKPVMQNGLSAKTALSKAKGGSQTHSKS